MSTTTCMERLLSASLRQACTSWLHPLLPMMMRLVFQQLLVEHDGRVQVRACVFLLHLPLVALQWSP